MKSSKLIEVLVEEIEEEVLDRLPKWLKTLRKAYAKKSVQ